jgi:malate permease and related proteins
MVFNVFSPALIFHNLATVTLAAGTAFRLVAVVLMVFVAVTVLSLVTSKALRHDRQTAAAVTLCAAVANSGNMGLPMAKLAFGDEGFHIALITFVATSLLTFSAGIVIASMASHAKIGRALVAPIRVPALWAAVAGLAVHLSGRTLPKAVDSVATTLGSASIPLMLVVLGLQVAHSTDRRLAGSDMTTAVVLRLVAAPLVAWGATAMVGLHGVPQRTLILIAGMPTAVMASVIAMGYEAKPALVSRVVVSSTLASILSLTVIVTLLT